MKRLTHLLNKKNKLLPRDQFIKEKAKEFSDLYKDDDINESTIDELLNMAEDRDELDPEQNPQAYSEILAEFTACVEATKEHAAEEEEVKEVKKTTDADLVKSIKGISYADSYAAFSEKFSLGEGFNQLTPKKGVTVTEKDYVGALALGIAMESAGQYVVADAALALINMGHENVVVQIAADFKRSYQTISSWIRTARLFPPDLRNPNVSFTVYKEIANAKLDEKPEKSAQLALKMAEKAAKEQWSSQEARAHVKEAQGGAEVKTTLPANFLLLNFQTKSPVLSQAEPPFQEEDVIVNLKTRQWLGLKDREGCVAWMDIPVQ